MNIVHLHIPHTGGRCLGRYAFKCYQQLKDKNITYTRLHNARNIADYLHVIDSTTDNTVFYFVLRDTTERLYKEFLHYSSRLQTVGMVNHLDLSDIQKRYPDFNVTSFSDYCRLEVNRNAYCKFLLLRTDFNIPITDTDYQQVLDLLKRGNFKYDVFDKPLVLHEFANLLDVETAVLQDTLSKIWPRSDKSSDNKDTTKTITTDHTESIKSNDVVDKCSNHQNSCKAEIVDNNKYDLLLFEFLS